MKDSTIAWRIAVCYWFLAVHVPFDAFPSRISLWNTTVLYLPLNTTSKTNRATKVSSVATKTTISAAITVSFEEHWVDHWPPYLSYTVYREQIIQLLWSRRGSGSERSDVIEASEHDYLNWNSVNEKRGMSHVVGMIENAIPYLTGYIYSLFSSDCGATFLRMALRRKKQHFSRPVG